MRYLAASIVIAAAGAVYGLFSHGVYSYYMTYAFMIPLLAGAVPHLLAAMKGERKEGKTAADGAAGSAISLADALTDGTAEVLADECAEEPANAAKSLESKEEPARKLWLDLGSAQLAFIVTLTAGSQLKGVLDIYGTTNRLLIAYPVMAALILAVSLLAALRRRGSAPAAGSE